MAFTQSDFDTVIWVVCLILASISFGWWMHSIGAGLFLFFAVLSWLFVRRM